MSAENWTLDPATGRTNSSPLFLFLVDEVARIISNARVGDHPEGHARLIMAQLAHIHGLVPAASRSEENELAHIHGLVPAATKTSRSEENELPVIYIPLAEEGHADQSFVIGGASDPIIILVGDREFMKLRPGEVIDLRSFERLPDGSITHKRQPDRSKPKKIGWCFIRRPMRTSP